MPRPHSGGIKQWCASDVCLTCLSHTSGQSREQTGLGRLKFAHVKRDSDTTSKINRSNWTCMGRGHIVAASYTACLNSVLFLCHWSAPTVAATCFFVWRLWVILSVLDIYFALLLAYGSLYRIAFRCRRQMTMSFSRSDTLYYVAVAYSRDQLLTLWNHAALLNHDQRSEVSQLGLRQCGYRAGVHCQLAARCVTSPTSCMSTRGEIPTTTGHRPRCVNKHQVFNERRDAGGLRVSRPRTTAPLGLSVGRCARRGGAAGRHVQVRSRRWRQPATTDVETNVDDVWNIPILMSQRHRQRSIHKDGPLYDAERQRRRPTRRC